MDEGRKLAYPSPADGLTHAEAGYERRVDAPSVFSGFRCRDCNYSLSPAQEEGFCSFIKKPINNPRGCYAYYVARNIGEIEATFQPEDPWGQLAIHLAGAAHVQTALEAVTGVQKVVPPLHL